MLRDTLKRSVGGTLPSKCLLKACMLLFPSLLVHSLHGSLLTRPVAGNDQLAIPKDPEDPFGLPKMGPHPPETPDETLPVGAIVICIGVLVIELGSEPSETLSAGLGSRPPLTAENGMVETGDFLLKGGDRSLEVMDKIPLEPFRVPVELVIADLLLPSERA
ncbi:uncharacterized protein N7443_007107 [Penicillium atrosanguineum]|uniref:uncharacterized protein n=1 Tax=Penicillium atrosanguineum TaxID=1132637 RepID=UPI0023923628|nr:uncharacterized protein N7443_007107 [Penicillium atrosanguineum]KAJ5296214.1 hypothetical protein N7443_007107 [Penicillium atrosanguineum]